MFIRSLSLRMSLDERLDVTSVISSAVPFKMAQESALTADLKVSRSWLVW